MELRGDGADQDAGGAEADDAAAILEELGQMGSGLAICNVAAGHAIGSVDFGVERRLELAGQWQGGGAEDEEDGLHHASVPA